MSSFTLGSGQPDYTALEFPAPPAERPYVYLNMVSSVDGKVIIEGTERGLGSPADQRLMRELRVHADMVLNGAGTLRASGTSSRLGDHALEALRVARGKPSTPIAATLSHAGDVPLERTFFTARDFEAVVYLSDAAPAERRRAIEATGRSVYMLPVGDEVRSMLCHMREVLGIRMLLVEGGPTVNGALVDLGVVDEFFLTLGPLIVGGNHPKTAVESARAPALDAVRHLVLLGASANPETQELYLRYRVGERD